MKNTDIILYTIIIPFFFIHNTSFFYFVIHGRDPTEEETPTGITAL